MDILQIGGIAFAGLMMLLGLVLVLKKPKSKPLPIDTLDLNNNAQLGALEQSSMTSSTQFENIATSDLLLNKPIKTKSLFDDDDFPIVGVTSNQQPPSAVKPSPFPVEIHPNQYKPIEEVSLESRVPPSPSISNTPPASHDTTSKSSDYQPAWTGESALLDSHLESQMTSDNQSTLAQAEQIVSIYVLPKAGKMNGGKLLDAFKVYGLRFGEMSLFHRFEHADGSGALMFSILQYTNEGPEAFDLGTLVDNDIQGLAFFLGLPNANAVHGFELMVHIAERLSKEFNANMFDEDMDVITRVSYEKYRQQVVDYQG